MNTGDLLVSRYPLHDGRFNYLVILCAKDKNKVRVLTAGGDTKVFRIESLGYSYDRT